MDSLTRIFRIFSNERRRYALYALSQANEPVSIEELADQVQHWETIDDDDAPDEYEDVIIALKHHHLPKAAQAEYIEYDREENEIRISGEPTEFRIILTVSEAIETTQQHQLLDLTGTTPKEFLAQLTTTKSASD